MPFAAKTAPMTEASVTERLSKLGGTPYVASDVSLTLDEGLMLPVSALNALRRDALANLSGDEDKLLVKTETVSLAPTARAVAEKTARFDRPEQIPEEAKTYFDHIYLPLERYDGSVDGVVIPPVIFDSESVKVEQMLREAVEKGARHALVGNLGHLDMVTAVGLVPHGDFRLNATNRATVAMTEQLGLADIIVSPELTLPQVRDVGGAKSFIVYGRLPLMILEKCVGRELGDCSSCTDGKLALCDRRGVRFPVLRVFDHRSLICNSIPTCMSDMPERLAELGICGQHFIFTVETARECREVIEAFQRKKPLSVPVRRIGRT